jgi:predicted O-methyltransferase YrrM
LALFFFIFSLVHLTAIYGWEEARATKARFSRAETPVSVFLASDKQVISERVKRQAFDWMGQLEGWCSDLKATTLVDLVLKVKPNIIVEIGVWGGKSLVPMACALQANGKGTIFGIDPWDSNASIEETLEEANKTFWSYANHDTIFRGLVHKIDQFALHDHVILIKNTSEDAALIPGIDILHIDGNHSEKTSYGDVCKWVPLMNSGGWIIFDDMTWTEKGINTTARAVEWLDQHCIKIGQFSDIYCVWGIWVKP